MPKPTPKVPPNSPAFFERDKPLSRPVRQTTYVERRNQITEIIKDFQKTKGYTEDSPKP